ncbi:EKC/KEOPS complex subunit LAGE3-like [Phoca vitulina]|uniref:EKC/KEOPS complex subunit LAGE3-like n=1 Tax=Phoca vitulina TaxID=9720 RepID=UPI001396349E|nr:EKC/KEOPS complex subunit LAGE3-like [Phoca vitulina]
MQAPDERDDRDERDGSGGEDSEDGEAGEASEAGAAGGAGTAGGAGGQDRQPSPGAAGCRERPGSPEGDGGPGGGEGEEGEAADAPAQAGQAAQALRPGGDAAPVAVAAASRLLEFTLTVPFRSPLEAEMALRSLAPHAQRHRGVVQKELAVNGSTLAVRWTAEDAIFFRVSINCFLDQLSLVMRNIRGFGPPPPESLGPRGGAEA